MTATPQPLTLSFIVLLFSLPRPPSLPQPPTLPTPRLPSVPTPQLPYIQTPTVQGPTVRGPSFQGPSFNGTTLQGPTFQGPSIQGPSYQGPTYQSAGARTSDRGNRAGFWLGVLIFLWSLAFASLIVLLLYISGFSLFNFQKYKAQDVLNAFNGAGLEVSKPTLYGSSNGFGSLVVPFSYQEGFNFTVPSSGAGATGGITSFSSGSELDKAKAFLLDPAKTGAIPYRVYTRDNILIYLNVSSEVKAKQYEAALLSLK